MAQDTTGTIIGAGGTVATAIVPALTAAAWAVPVVGAAAAGLLLAWQFYRRRGQQKVAATEVIEKSNEFWQKNLDAYFKGPRTKESQAAALAMFDDVWNWVAGPEGCGSSDLGAAGRRCIEERKRGGTVPWCANAKPGEFCGDAFQTFRDPIANDTPSNDDVASLFAAGGILSPGGNGAAGLLLPLALAGAALAL